MLSLQMGLVHISCSWRPWSPQDHNGMRMGRRGRKILTHWENMPASHPLEQEAGWAKGSAAQTSAGPLPGSCP